MDIKRKKLIIVGIIFTIVCFCLSYFLVFCDYSTSKEALLEDSKIEYQEINNGIYFGEVISEVANGDGALYYKNGDIYIGDFKDNLISGKGEYIFNNKDEYKGDYVSGKREGEGTYTFSDGSIYSGDWKKDAMDGDGTYTFKNGNQLKGKFKNNKFETGQYIAKSDEGKAVIEMKDGKATGELILTDRLGDEYSGTLKAGKFNGKCTIEYENGDKYTGNIVNNKKSGKGIYQWSDGDKYEGYWSKDKMNGTGTYYYNVLEETYLSGTFLNNKPNGTCEYHKDSSTTYTTVWKDGVCTAIKD